MENRIIDSELTLIPYYPNEEVTLAWYQDPELCKQVDDKDGVYSLENLQAMYNYLNKHGHLYYISYQGHLVGDICLQDNSEVCIVICKAYQNRHIGRRCIPEMLKLAREQGLQSVKAHIYSFNTQSQRMFLAAGFVHTEGEWYEYTLA